MMRAVLFAGLVAATLASPVSSDAPRYQERFIFPATPGRGHVHASSVIETPSGGLIAAWYENGDPREHDHYLGTDADKRSDVRIGAARLPPGASTWAEPFVISDTFGVSDNNPMLAVDAAKRLWLIHPTMLTVPERTWGSALLQYKVSSDYQGSGPPRWDVERILVIHPNGLDEVVARAAAELRRHGDEQLERAAALVDRLNDPFARRLGWMPGTHPLVLPDGGLLVPIANENFNAAAMAMTRDGGETWEMSQTVPGLGVIQPSVVRLSDGRLAAYFRDARGEGRILHSESADGGITWSAPVVTDLPNPGSRVEAVTLQNGHVALVYNDKEERPRDRLAVSISTDDGKTWRWTRHLANTPGERFDYPSIIQARDGSLHVTYSYNLRTIKHVAFDEAWVQEESGTGTSKESR
ncbi:MAG: hypothetical protein GEU99_20375 [Luteitalea sp.]|nr:hypothetical protein [Luteitalea sp.]